MLLKHLSGLFFASLFITWLWISATPFPGSAAQLKRTTFCSGCQVRLALIFMLSITGKGECKAVDEYTVNITLGCTCELYGLDCAAVREPDFAHAPPGVKKALFFYQPWR